MSAGNGHGDPIKYASTEEIERLARSLRRGVRRVRVMFFASLAMLVAVGGTSAVDLAVRWTS